MCIGVCLVYVWYLFCDIFWDVFGNFFGANCWSAGMQRANFGDMLFSKACLESSSLLFLRQSPAGHRVRKQAELEKSIDRNKCSVVLCGKPLMPGNQRQQRRAG